MCASSKHLIHMLHRSRPLRGDNAVIRIQKKYVLCMGSHLLNPGPSSQKQIWLTGLLLFLIPQTNHFNRYTLENCIFITIFICHELQFQMTQKGTHQSTIFHDVQALLDMSQRSYNSHILMLHLSICD